MKENLSGMESLEIIEQMIKKAKNQFSEDGTLYLLWGWVILCCSLAHFIIDHFQLFSQPWAVWSVTWVVALYMLAFIRKRDSARRVKTYTEDILGKIWFTFVIMMLVIIFILQAYIPEFYRYNFMFILVCYAMPTFLSGYVLQFRPLIMGGACCWALALLAGLVDFHYHPLFVSAAVILAWIIPGYILKSRYRKQTA